MAKNSTRLRNGCDFVGLKPQRLDTLFRPDGRLRQSSLAGSRWPYQCNKARTLCGRVDCRLEIRAVDVQPSAEAVRDLGDVAPGHLTQRRPVTLVRRMIAQVEPVAQLRAEDRAREHATGSAGVGDEPQQALPQCFSVVGIGERIPTPAKSLRLRA